MLLLQALHSEIHFVRNKNFLVFTEILTMLQKPLTQWHGRQPLPISISAGDDWDWCAVMVKGLAVLQLSGLPKWTVSCVGTPAATWSGWKLSVLPCSGQDLSYSFSQASHGFMVFCILVICKCVSHDQELSYQVKQIVKERGILDVKYLISCNCSYIFLPVEFKVKEQSRNNCHSPHFSSLQSLLQE